jgi:8-oxo-dGTP pyrophosphatase MutT (NUDIX family)
MEKINPKRHFTASAFIFHKGKTLLIEHKKMGTWLFPGGHIEPNETPDEAICREIKEEAGIEVSFVDKMDKNLEDERAVLLHRPFVVLCEFIGISGNEHYHIDMVYICESDTDKIKINKNETKNLGWFSYEESQNLNLFPNFRSLLKRAFEYMDNLTS